jgi:hypothetical protein
VDITIILDINDVHIQKAGSFLKQLAACWDRLPETAAPPSKINSTINIEAQMPSPVKEDDKSDVLPRISNEVTIQRSYGLDDEKTIAEAATFSIARHVCLFVLALLPRPSYGSPDPRHEAKLDPEQTNMSLVKIKVLSDDKSTGVNRLVPNSIVPILCLWKQDASSCSVESFTDTSLDQSRQRTTSWRQMKHTLACLVFLHPTCD